MVSDQTAVILPLAMTMGRRHHHCRTAEAEMLGSVARSRITSRGGMATDDFIPYPTNRVVAP